MGFLAFGKGTGQERSQSEKEAIQQVRKNHKQLKQQTWTQSMPLAHGFLMPEAFLRVGQGCMVPMISCFQTADGRIPESKPLLKPGLLQHESNLMQSGRQ